MRTRRLIFLCLLLCVLAGCAAPVAPRRQNPAQMSVAEGMAQADVSGYARADKPRVFVFPADHGPHPEYAIEWWYATGNLRAANGAEYGYQFTIFRTAMPQRPAATAASAWRADAVYMAHFALTDVGAQTFSASERFQRGTLGLAGAQAAPLRVWVDDWQFVSPADGQVRIVAASADAAVDLTLDLTAPVLLQGDDGLSQKSAGLGNASYYYSIPRMQTRGTVRSGAVSTAVSGLSWLDREWSTSALAPDQVGWDWFALHLDDGSDLMLYQLRTPTGATHPYSSGMHRSADGTQTRLAATDITWTPRGSWISPHTSAAYPAAWQLTIAPLALELEVTPVLADQELPVLVRYWEGAVRVAATQAGTPLGGAGYLEMTGYADKAVATP